jgi:hypothetical protein
MPSMPRRVALAPVLVLLLAVAVACGGDDAVEPAAFELRMQERYGADLVQARCLQAYAYDDYDDDGVRVLFEEGVTGLPKNLWDPFVLAVIACLHDPS